MCVFFRLQWSRSIVIQTTGAIGNLQTSLSPPVGACPRGQSAPAQRHTLSVHAQSTHCRVQRGPPIEPHTIGDDIHTVDLTRTFSVSCTIGRTESCSI